MSKIDILEQELYEESPALLNLLLRDMTTKGYVRWGTDNYSHLGPVYRADAEMTPDTVIGRNTNVLQPRVSKSAEEQFRRTRDKAEVFTPSWICNKQNNLIDEAWFGRKNVFNTEHGKEWSINNKKITFPKEKTWKDYVIANCLEVSCGEAPYLVSRYDSVTGNEIPIPQRIGLLDRKLRVILEHVTTFEKWHDWALKAYQSVYGFDFQGDNVVLARENFLLTYIDYSQEFFVRLPPKKYLLQIAKIIAWNIWQMDGIKMAVPYVTRQKKIKSPEPILKQGSLLNIEKPKARQIVMPLYQNLDIPCMIKDWQKNIAVPFNSLKGKNL